MVASFAGGYYMGGNNHSVEIKEVDKIQTQENVRTIIEERPDGSKSTTIVESRATQARHELSIKAEPPRKWLISLSRDFSPIPEYTLGVSYRVLPRAFLGVTGATDGTVGVSLSYEF